MARLLLIAILLVAAMSCPVSAFCKSSSLTYDLKAFNTTNCDAPSTIPVFLKCNPQDIIQCEGFKICVFPDEAGDLVSQELRTEKIWEPPNTIFFSELFEMGARSVPAGGTPPLVVDAGAYLGYFSLLAASKGLKVKAFEPLRRQRERFLSSIRENGWEDLVEVFPYVLSSEDGGVVPMHSPADNYGGSHVIFYDMDGPDGGARSFHPTCSAGTALASTRRLDTAVTQPVYFLKIDVEGHGGQLLSGARRLIEGAGDAAPRQAEADAELAAALAGSEQRAAGYLSGLRMEVDELQQRVLTLMQQQQQQQQQQGITGGSDGDGSGSGSGEVTAAAAAQQQQASVDEARKALHTATLRASRTARGVQLLKQREAATARARAARRMAVAPGQQHAPVFINLELTPRVEAQSGCAVREMVHYLYRHGYRVCTGMSSTRVLSLLSLQQADAVVDGVVQRANAPGASIFTFDDVLFAHPQQLRRYFAVKE